MGGEQATHGAQITGPLAATRLTTWAPRRRTHLLCLACAALLTLFELSMVEGLEPSTGYILLIVLSGVGLALVSPWPLVGSALTLLAFTAGLVLASSPAEPSDPVLGLKVWLCACVLVSRGFPRVLPYGMVGASITLVAVASAVVPATPGSTGAYLYMVILGSACLIVAELMRQPRTAADAAAQQHEADMERQRLLVVSELHDTVVRDLSHAVMLAEQARLAKGPGASMEGELAAMTAAVRAAVEQLRTNLRSIGQADSSGGLDLLASIAPRPLEEVAHEARALLAGRGVTLEVKGMEVLGTTGIPPGVRQQLVRVLGELVTNMAKYAAPGGPARLVIESDGTSLEAMASNAMDTGSATSAPPDDAASSGLGLTGVRRRVEALSGTMIVEAGADRFTVVVGVPLARPENVTARVGG